MVLAKSIYGMGLVILFGSLFSASPLQAQGECKPHRQEIKAIHKSFGESVEIVPILSETGVLSESEFYHPGDCIYRITNKDNVSGYLLSTRAKGRYDFFDYSVIFTEDIAVQQVFVTVYRSTHGAAICQKKWLGQFEGYRGETLELGSDIDAVSGATFSASSLVMDIQRTYLLLSSQIEE